jgi:uncharacterized membrane protein YbhN (UPF0104 family)
MQQLSKLRWLLRPRVLIPAIIIGGLVVALFGFADLHQVARLIVGFQRSYLLFFFLLMLAYTTIRGAQWLVLMHALAVPATLRAQIFAFLGGEVTKYMPIGNYFQGYLLQEASGADFARTSAASTLIVLIEVAISLAALVIIGINGWDWLRPVIVIGLAVFSFIAWSVARLHDSLRLPPWFAEHAWYRAARKEFDQFCEGAADLLDPAVLAKVVPLGAAYTLCAGGALYVVVLGLGVQHLSFWQALAAYYFSLAFTLIVPVPIDLGAFEASGIGALITMGVDRNAAVSIVLINRALGIGYSIVVALAAFIVLRDELRAALGSRQEKRGAAPPPATVVEATEAAS